MYEPTLHMLDFLSFATQKYILEGWLVQIVRYFQNTHVVSDCIFILRSPRCRS